MNLLEALNRLANNPNFKIPKKGTDYDNSIQEVGSGLEAYFKLLFVDESASVEALNEAFSYTGGANHPPDLITSEPQIAFEIKKVGSDKRDIQLNSSYPEQCLLKGNHRLTEQCRSVIKTDQIPLIYVIGVVREDNLTKLWIVDGKMYAANQSIYSEATEIVSSAIKDSGIGNLYETVELANLRDIDPLNNTIMRVRGMWIIKRPSVVFSSLGNLDGMVTAILSKETYELFPENTHKSIEDLSRDSRQLSDNSLSIHFEEIECNSPDDPDRKIEAILLELKDRSVS